MGYYLVSALLFTLSGTLYSLLLRLELYGSGNRIIHSENLNSYNLSVTLHGLIMIFFVIMPVLYGGLANYFLPIYILAPEVSLPRINCLSLLILPYSYSYLLISLFTEFGAATGWTFYPPLSTSLMSLSPVGVDMRGYGLTSTFSSLYICSIFITAILLLFTLPVLTGALFMVFSDLHFNTIFFDATFYGDPILYQHLFWFFGHPEVYILIIPAFG